MGITTKLNLLLLLLALHSPCNFIQSPLSSPNLTLLQPSPRASQDFGRLVFNPPTAVSRPTTPQALSTLLGFINHLGGISVAARGEGHSNHGQAQALDGVVVEMEALGGGVVVGEGFAEVGGGVTWVEVLEEGLKLGLAPRSWTDYLYLSVGGTLSNAGVGGQTFKFGPQISNVMQLDVVTGSGEIVTCSPTKRSDLFNAVLGGLGQFGIITSARIALQEAPHNVKWVRVFYDDFGTFTTDQELLVSMPSMVDYVEGFVVLNEQSLNSPCIAFPSQIGFTSVLHSGTSKVFYCLEFAIHECHTQNNTHQVLEEITEKLNFMPTQIYTEEVSYYDFLNRVRLEELNLRSKELWNVPHPWLNMFVPKSGIKSFKDLLLDTISLDNFDGHILIYPTLKDKWDTNTSVVLPDSPDNLMYIVGILRLANPNTCSTTCLREILRQNRHIADMATGESIGAKEYLAHYSGEEAWRKHFGRNWDRFVERKASFDPLHVLAPGQGIFERKLPPPVAGGVDVER